MAAFRGSCICGEVAFEVEGPFDHFLNCHCSRCRKATGTAHSCEVIVKAPSFEVKLNEGDFFGEMGLLTDQPRNADVIADGYCHLLVLHRKDFRDLLDKRPAVRAEIEAVAARRIAETASEGQAAS